MGSSDLFTHEPARALGELRAVGVRARRMLVFRGATEVLAIAVAAAFASLALDWWLRPGPAVRAVATILTVGGLATLLWRRVIAPAKTRIEPLDVAAVWDRIRGDGRDRLVQAVGTLSTGVTREGSPELTGVSCAEACVLIRGADLVSNLDVARSRRRLAALAALLLIPIAGAAIAPDLAGLWFRRFFLASSERWPQATWLEVAGLRGGELVVPAREPFAVQVSAREGSTVPEMVEIRYEIDGGEARTDVMKRAESNRFDAELPAASAGARLWLRGGDDELGPVIVTARERPQIAAFHLATRAPGDAAAVTKTFETQDEDLRFLEGTRVELEVHAGEDAAALEVGGTGQPGATRQVGPRAFRLEWTHERACALVLEVESAATGLRSRPRNLAFGVYRDTPPRVQLECPGIGERIAPTARVPCRVEARDDLAVAALRLDAGVQPGGDESGPTSRSKGTELPLGDQAGRAHVVAEEELRVADLGAAPGSRVRIVAVASDRRHPRPQEGASRARVLTVVPREVLLAEILLRLQAVRARFRTALNDARAGTDELAAPLAPEAVSAHLKKWRLNERALWSIRRSVEAGVREISLNAVLEEEVVRMLERTVVVPFAELERGLLAEQRAAIEQAAEGGLAGSALAAARERQIRIVGAMESILKGMDRWDSFVDLIAQLGEVIKLQTDARKDAQDAADRRREVPRDK
jgi:hypothetical protein